MRYQAIGAGLAALLLAAGCNSWPHLRPAATSEARQPIDSNVPTAAALVNYLNDNARRVQSIDCGELELDCKQGMQAITLYGWMVCQKPRNFRMGAKVVGKDAVDMGSNDKEFWYWLSKVDPPYQFHCSYDDLAKGTAIMPFPFQPDWIVGTLGMQEYGPAENYQVVAQARTVELVERTTGPKGEPMRKVTVIERSQGQVTAHLLQDASGKLICSARILEAQKDAATGARIPKRLTLEYPSERLTMTLKLDHAKVNPTISDQRATALFNRPRYANIESYDLGRRGLDRAIQPAGGRGD